MIQVEKNMIQQALSFVKDNYKWIFGGIGVSIVGFLIKKIFDKKEPSVRQKQKSGHGSTNVQIGNINTPINDRKD